MDSSNLRRRAMCGPGSQIMSQKNAEVLAAFFDECSVAEFVERLLKLLFAVHHDRAVPGNRLFQRPPRYEQEPDALVARLNRYLVAIVEQDQRPVAQGIGRRGCSPGPDLLGHHPPRFGG